MEKNAVNIFLYESNLKINRNIKKELSEIVNNSPLKNIYNIKLYSFTKPVSFMSKIKKTGTLQEETIVFFDENSGDNRLYNKIYGYNNSVKIVLMSDRSGNTKNVTTNLYEKRFTDFIFKDQYTAAVCSLYLEQYLENLVVNKI